MSSKTKMKLKTLKDLSRLDHRHPDYDVEVVRLTDVRDEAIKWVKDKNQLTPTAKYAFRDFFNITSEDLK